jgi:hypothetical protein
MDVLKVRCDILRLHFFFLERNKSLGILFVGFKGFWVVGD